MTTRINRHWDTKTIVTVACCALALSMTPSTGEAQQMYEITMPSPTHLSNYSSVVGQTVTSDTWRYETPVLASADVAQPIVMTINLPERINPTEGVIFGFACEWDDGSSATPAHDGTLEATFVDDTSGMTLDLLRGVLDVGFGLDIVLFGNGTTVAGLTFQTLVLTYTPSAHGFSGNADGFDECSITLQQVEDGDTGDPGPLYTVVTSVCGDAVVEGDEECDGGECCDDDCTFKDSGAACGDDTDDTCTAPDTCDGNGACDDNHAEDATPCETGTFCLAGDTCATGVCQEGSDDACAPGETCDEGNRMCITPQPDAGTPDSGTPDAGSDAGPVFGFQGNNGCTVRPTGASRDGWIWIVAVLLGLTVVNRRSR